MVHTNVHISKEIDLSKYVHFFKKKKKKKKKMKIK